MLYVDDVPAVLAFYARALGLRPRFYDEATGFAELGADGRIAVASHAAGALMMGAAYPHPASRGPTGVELAFFTGDVAAAFGRAVDAGAFALSAPHAMPWGQTVAYVRAPDGSLLGFLTPPPTAVAPGAASDTLADAPAG